MTYHGRGLQMTSSFLSKPSNLSNVYFSLLNSLEIVNSQLTISGSSHVAANDTILFFFYG